MNLVTIEFEDHTRIEQWLGGIPRFGEVLYDDGKYWMVKQVVWENHLPPCLMVKEVTRN